MNGHILGGHNTNSEIKTTELLFTETRSAVQLLFE